MSLHLVIGNKNYSSWSFRPWIAMKLADIAFDETVISLDAPDFKTRVTALGGSGRVPVLIDGNAHVWESLANPGIPCRKISHRRVMSRAASSTRARAYRGIRDARRIRAVAASPADECDADRKIPRT